MKRIVAAALLAIFWLADAPSAQGADGWWTGTIRTVYTPDSGIVLLQVDAPVPQGGGIQCGDPSPNIQLRRSVGDGATSRFEVIYENLANSASTGSTVSLYLRERTFSDGSAYCLIGEVGDWRPQRNVGTGTTTGGGSANRIQISTSAPSSVRPLQFITLAVAGGTAGAEYDVLIDLSGTGAFSADDIAEVVAVKDAEGRLLVASPLPEAFAAEGNAARSFAVRVRRRGSETVSNTLTLTLAATNVPSSLAGHPTVILDVLLKGLYEGLDDPLLIVEAGAIEPGRSVRTARALGLSTAYSDAQAAALLHSLFGASLAVPSSASASGRRATAFAGPRSAALRCEALAPDALCNTMERVADCVGDSMRRFGTRSEGGDSFGRCARIVREDFVEGLQDYGEKIHAFGNGLRSFAPRMARFLGVGRPAAQQLFDRNAVLKQVVGLQKTLRTIEDLPQRAKSLRQNIEAMRDTAKALTEGYPELITKAEQDVTADGVDDDEREAFFALVEEADYHYSDAAAVDDEELEDVYTGEADVAETLGTVADGGGPATCADGYEEFSVDDKTSTCVLSSLVERDCYAGSREVSHPDLGGAGACLYYSLDFLQPDGTCRENYAKVTFQGRETCRWAELGADKSAWYSLDKEHGVESPQIPQMQPTDTQPNRYYGAYALGNPVHQCRGYACSLISGTATYANTPSEADRKALDDCEDSSCSVISRFFDGQCRVHAHNDVATKPISEPDPYRGIHFWDVVAKEHARVREIDLKARCEARYQELHYKGSEGTCWSGYLCNP